jgi:hypothetical protein
MARDIKTIMAQVVVDLCAGRMDPRLGWTISYAANTFMKTIELDDLVNLKTVEVFHKEVDKRSPDHIEYFANHGYWPYSPFVEKVLTDCKNEEGLGPGADQQSARGLAALQHFPEDCVCFPPNEQPELPLDYVSEREAIAAVSCPLHGKRFRQIVEPTCFVPNWRYENERKSGWPGRSAQFRKAMLASRPSQAEVYGEKKEAGSLRNDDSARSDPQGTLGEIDRDGQQEEFAVGTEDSAQPEDLPLQTEALLPEENSVLVLPDSNLGTTEDEPDAFWQRQRRRKLTMMRLGGLY